jgi:2-oxoglutarate dehydrogenase E1 component
VAIVRVEQLYPFPSAELEDVLATYPRVREVAWVQEEPMNMGAYWHVKRRLEPKLPKHLTLRYVGRPERASPSEGYAIAHEAQEQKIVDAALAPSGESTNRPASG